MIELPALPLYIFLFLLNFYAAHPVQDDSGRCIRKYLALAGTMTFFGYFFSPLTISKASFPKVFCFLNLSPFFPCFLR